MTEFEMLFGGIMERNVLVDRFKGNALSGILKNWQITLLTLIIGYGVPLLGGTLGCFEVVFYSSLAFGIGTFVHFDKLVKPGTWFKCLIVFSVLTAMIAKKVRFLDFFFFPTKAFRKERVVHK